MNSPEQQRPPKRTMDRLRRLTSPKRPGSQSITEIVSKPDDAVTNPRETNATNAFLRLPQQLRQRIYEFAFTTSTPQIFTSLHYGSHAGPADALLLTCRQTRHEVLPLRREVEVVRLWPHHRYDHNTLLDRKSVLRTWASTTRDGLLVAQQPASIRIVALPPHPLGRGTQSRAVYDDIASAPAKILPKIVVERVEELYLRVCICNSLRWLHERPHEIEGFCSVLEGFAEHFPQLRRVGVMYCGQKWPQWIHMLGDVEFAEIVVKRQEEQRATGWTVERQHGEDDCRLRTVMSKIEEATPQGDMMERRLAVDYYDSWTVLEDRCVRNKPVRKGKSASGASMLTTPLTGFAKRSAIVKEFVEAAPLGPTWGLHKYNPITRNASSQDRGSHWRRY